MHRGATVSGERLAKMGFVDGSDGEKLVDGIYYPTDLSRLRTQTGVSYVLLQQEGKRRIKDLHDTVRQRQMSRTGSEHEGAMARGAAADDLEALDDPAVPKEMKQQIFERELQRVQAALTENELRLGVSVGK